MKTLHAPDWHLGRTLHGRKRLPGVCRRRDLFGKGVADAEKARVAAALQVAEQELQRFQQSLARRASELDARTVRLAEQLRRLDFTRGKFYGQFGAGSRVVPDGRPEGAH